MTRALPILVLLSLLVSSARADTVVPPRLASGQHVHAPYPPTAAPGTAARVILEIMVDSAGAVLEQQPVETRIDPDSTPSEPFVQSALEHARTLRFEPALREGAPVAATIRIELITSEHFTPHPRRSPRLVVPVTCSPRHHTRDSAPMHRSRRVQCTPSPPASRGRRPGLRSRPRIGSLRAVPRRTAPTTHSRAGVVLQNHPHRPRGTGTSALELAMPDSRCRRRHADHDRATRTRTATPTRSS